MNWSKMGIGGAIGSQFNINDNFVIDIMWLEFNIDYHSFSFHESTTDHDSGYTTDNQCINEALPLLSNLFNLETNSTNQSFSSKTGALLVGFRFKLAISYVF